jgi:hypothetical protein
MERPAARIGGRQPANKASRRYSVAMLCGVGLMLSAFRDRGAVSRIRLRAVRDVTLLDFDARVTLGAGGCTRIEAAAGRNLATNPTISDEQL